MPSHFQSLGEAAAWYRAWLTEAALPLWSSAGVDASRGSFQEALGLDGAPVSGPRRSRVQSRQVWVFATAALRGLGSGYAEVARAGYAFWRDRYRNADGLLVYAADEAGRPADRRVLLYEQAFALLAMAARDQLDPGVGRADAAVTRAGLETLRHPAGGFVEAGDQPFQANAHMHLLEASLAWEEAGDPSWRSLSDEVVELAQERFVGGDGVLREFFDENWQALDDRSGGLVEPGHQFEWAWLIHRWGKLRRDLSAGSVAALLYRTGLRGVDPMRNVAIDALWSDLSVREATARLWPQTERLRAALTLGDEVDALSAANGLRRFLEGARQGQWNERMSADGKLVGGPAPATSLYHLFGGLLPLVQGY